MYSADMKLQQEEYDNLFLPFNYAQVECNHIYREMIHHIICSAVVPTDTIVDVFGKLGLVPALASVKFYSDEMKRGHHFVIKYLATKLIQTKEGVLYD